MKCNLDPAYVGGIRRRVVLGSPYLCDTDTGERAS